MNRLYPGTGCGMVAEMDARRGPGRDDPFEEAIDEALSSIPWAAMPGRWGRRLK